MSEKRKGHFQGIWLRDFQIGVLGIPWCVDGGGSKEESERTERPLSLTALPEQFPSYLFYTLGFQSASYLKKVFWC